MAGGGGGVRWNDEEQRWEAEPAGVRPSPSPPPAPVVAPSPPPVPPVPPVPPGDPRAAAPDPYAGAEPCVPPGPQGPYNNLTGGYATAAASRSVRDRITPLTAGIAAAVLAAGAAGLWSASAGGDDGGRDDARGRTASAAAEEHPGPADPGAEGAGDRTGTPSGTPGTGSPDAPPPGYLVRDDAEGFRITVPEEWGERSEKNGAVFYKPLAGAELIQVFRVSEPGMTALEAVTAASEGLSANPGFAEIRLGPVAGPSGGEAAELVYAYDSEESGSRRQVVERVFTASDGRLYAVLVAAPDSQWPRHEEILDLAVTRFDPYGSPF
ncbi:photosystem II reaction center PsbP family protein [Streptomyces sp. NBC_01178]|uniref:serine/arginine repetitive matrix protein 2 n=1 Tax=Streptomyces sp. NBC_01178 TaxID=2903762 RepID=UPI00386CF2FA|nr:photosystem II reaction center PsbP family protein [Streptomyces sp. NBC_01178]